MITNLILDSVEEIQIIVEFSNEEQEPTTSRTCQMVDSVHSKCISAMFILIYLEYGRCVTVYEQV